MITSVSRLCLESMASFDWVVAGSIIENFAIEGDPHGFIFVMHRLPAIDVDDAQPCVSQPDRPDRDSDASGPRWFTGAIMRRSIWLSQGLPSCVTNQLFRT